MKILSILFLSLCCMTLISCSDDGNCDCDDNLYQKWEVDGFVSIESRSYSKDNDYSPTIEFKRDGSLTMELDVNNCFSSFELGNSGSIRIEGPGCTEACCDSEFSVKVVETLPLVETYNINEEGNLELNVPKWGWMVLVPMD